MSIIRQSKIEDFNKLINQKKFKKIFVITGKNSFYKSKANLFLKFEEWLHHFWETFSKLPLQIEGFLHLFILYFSKNLP